MDDPSKVAIIRKTAFKALSRDLNSSDERVQGLAFELASQVGLDGNAKALYNTAQLTSATFGQRASALRGLGVMADQLDGTESPSIRAASNNSDKFTRDHPEPTFRADLTSARESLHTRSH
jgi:hypothetical protein